MYLCNKIDFCTYTSMFQIPVFNLTKSKDANELLSVLIFVILAPLLMILSPLFILWEIISFFYKLFKGE